MKINSARQAWHDCKYNPAPGQTSDAVSYTHLTLPTSDLV